MNGAEAPPGMHVSPVGRKAEALRVGLEAGPGPSGVVGDRDREPKLLKLGTLEFSRNCHRSGTSGRNPAQPLPTAGPELEEELAGDPAEPPPPPGQVLRAGGAGGCGDAGVGRLPPAQPEVRGGAAGTLRCVDARTGPAQGPLDLTVVSDFVREPPPSQAAQAEPCREAIETGWCWPRVHLFLVKMRPNHIGNRCQNP